MPLSPNGAFQLPTDSEAPFRPAQIPAEVTRVATQVFATPLHVYSPAGAIRARSRPPGGATVTLVASFCKLSTMKLRVLVVLVTFVGVAIVATRRPPIVKPLAERGTWTPAPSDQ